MGRILNGILRVDAYNPTGNPGEYSFTDAIYTNQADPTGDGSLAVTVGWVLYVPSADPNTSEPVPGGAHRYKILSIENADGTYLSATITWDEDGSEVDTILNGSVAIISEPSQNKRFVLSSSTGVYPDLPSGINEAVYSGDIRFLTDKMGTGGVGGSVFITDIIPQSIGNVGNKVYEDGTVLQSCTSSTLDINVFVMALTGSHYKPVVTIDSTSITNFVVSPSVPIWSGSTNISIIGTEAVIATHEDGATSSCSLTYQPPPEILSAIFSDGVYPGSQTELKENDTMNLFVTSDVSMSGITVLNYGAGKVQVYSFAPTTSTTISITIADRGTSPQLLSVQLKAKDAYEAYGSIYDTLTGGSIELTNTVKLNNLFPSVILGSISYPAGQGALKDSETATIDTTIVDTDTISFTSPNGDLSITNPSLIEASKTVQRISGTYNVNTTNLRSTANRIANNSTTISNSVVYIAHVAATISITEPYSRLRSGGNAGTSAQNYTITVTSNQNLYVAPTLTAPAGTWQGDGFTGGPKIWTRTIQIHDNDTKGIYTWTALVATNIANIQTTSITGDAQYTLGGFVFRTMTIAAWPNREGSIGTQVANTAKLRCTNLSKGSSGSLNFTFQISTTNVVDRYTITQPTGVYNATGNLWYNCDVSNAVSNTSGTCVIELEEIV